MRVTILVLEECVVEMVRAKGESECAVGVSQVSVQLQPFVHPEIRDRLKMAASHQEALAEHVLVVIQDEPPMRALGNDGAKRWVA
jgi:hypothetical protein